MEKLKRRAALSAAVLCLLLAVTAASAYIRDSRVRALPAEELAAYLKRYGKPVTACGSIREGVSEAQDQAGDDAMVCAVGSLYMAGEIRYCMGMY